MRNSARLISSGLLACLAIPLAAQETEQGDVPAAEGDAKIILVTGRGLPQLPSSAAYASSEIERQAIISASSGRIEDVLQGVAGFQQFRRSDSRSSNPSAQGVTLRALGGNASSRALVLLDGVPMMDPFFGYIPLSAVAPEQLANIRITRGGGSGPFGSGALAGTIEMESADPAALGPISASLLANDRGETEASASLARELGAGFGVIGARWDRGQGFHTTPQDQRVQASARAAFDSWSIGARGAAPVGDSAEVQARVLLFRDERTLRFQGADSSSQGQDASIRFISRGEWQVDALAYVQARNFSNVVISSTRFTRALDQRNTPTTGLGGRLELRPPVGGNHNLRIGMDYRRSGGELQEEAYSAFSGNLTQRRRAGGTNSDLGFYVDDDVRLGAVVLTGGLRTDRTGITGGFYRAVDAGGAVVEETIAADRRNWLLSWRAGMAWQANKALRMRAAAYTGSRLPTLNELYRPFVVFPVVTRANAELRNERLEGFEAGFDLAPNDAMRFSLTVFDNRVNHAIANVTLGPDLRQRQNLPAIEAQGVEASLVVRMGKFRLDGSLSYTDATIDGSGTSAALDGNRPPQVPRWAGSLTFGWMPAGGWQLAATLRHVGAQFEDDLEVDSLVPATTIGAFARVPIAHQVSLIFRGENLTGENIVTRNAAGSMDLGTPRTFWAGLRYSI